MTLNAVQVCSALWRAARAPRRPPAVPEAALQGIEVRSSEDFGRGFADSLDLFAQGLGEMPLDSSDYPLHQAVFDNNLLQIRKLIRGER